MRHNPSQFMQEVGRKNTEAVRNLLVTCPGITNREIATKLGMNDAVIGRHVRKLRKEWESDFWK